MRYSSLSVCASEILEQTVLHLKAISVVQNLQCYFGMLKHKNENHKTLRKVFIEIVL